MAIKDQSTGSDFGRAAMLAIGGLVVRSPPRRAVSCRLFYSALA